MVIFWIQENGFGVEGMRNIYHVKTPENVTLEFELAGVGTRGIAVIIDTLFQYLILLVVLFISYLILDDDYINMMYSEENTVYIVLAILLIFIVQVGYFLLSEFFTKGSTLGKKIVGLKVIMANGEPISFTASLVRNLLRIGDMLPGIYGVGIFAVVLNKRYMRIGDLAANTVVVKVKKRKADFSGINNIGTERQNMFISPKEEALLIEYNERIRDKKNPLYSETLENMLYHHFYNKLGSLPNLPGNFNRRTYLKCLLKHLGIT
jgi:uncharacterized RDD family membrane protein YckC